jgi:ESF2/ABP1 family protein
VRFTEGWVEFKSKRAAKYVAEILNNNKISTRKKHRYYDHVWSIKYLPK